MWFSLVTWFMRAGKEYCLCSYKELDIAWLSKRPAKCDPEHYFWEHKRYSSTKSRQVTHVVQLSQINVNPFGAHQAGLPPRHLFTSVCETSLPSCQVQDSSWQTAVHVEHTCSSKNNKDLKKKDIARSFTMSWQNAFQGFANSLEFDGERERILTMSMSISILQCNPGSFCWKKNPTWKTAVACNCFRSLTLLRPLWTNIGSQMFGFAINCLKRFVLLAVFSSHRCGWKR